MKPTRTVLAAAPRRLVALLAVAALIAPAAVGAHPQTNGYEDHFETLGPLPSGTGDPWQVTSSGRWEVADQPAIENLFLAGTMRVLQQNSRATVPNEPMAFVRGKSFRSFTAQVTAAIADGTTLTDLVPSASPPPGSSVGIVFRAPILANGEADKENNYLFAALQAGVSNSFPSGRAFMLFKRVARGYYETKGKIVHTYMNLREPHQYKVAVGGGHILCFVDGRLVIDHTDIPSPDEPTTADPLPGVPFDAGAVGLRTTGARAWFDDFVVVGTDAYEGRAQLVDGYASASANLNPSKGTARQLTLAQADTGYQYHDHEFDEAIIRPVEGPDGGDGPEIGPTVRTSADNGVVTSTARLAGVHVEFEDPTKRVKVVVDVDALEAVATAACSSTTTAFNIVKGSFSVVHTPAAGDRTPPTVLGPFPLSSDYPANTLVYEQPGTVAITAHARSVSTLPRRVEASLLKIVFPEQPIRSPRVTNPSNGQTIVPESTLGTSPQIELALGKVVAGRYCS